MIYILSILIFSQIYFFTKIKSKYFDTAFFSKEKTPNIGGFIIIANVYLTCLYFDQSFSFIFHLIFILSVLFIFDDIKFFKVHRSVEVFLKISLQLLFITIMFFQIENLLNFNFLFIIFLIIFCIFVVNASNFIDGLNGFLGSHILFSLFSLILIHFFENKFNNDIQIIILLIVGISIFLIFNFPRGQIFLGDSGSVPFGLLISYILMMNINNDFKYNFFIFLYPLLDVTFTLLERIYLKKNFFGRLFDYAIFVPIKKYEKPHYFVTIFSVISQIVQLLLLFYYIQYKYDFFIILNILNVLILFIYFKFNSFKKLT